MEEPMAADQMWAVVWNTAAAREEQLAEEA